METSPILSTKDFNTNTSIQDVPQSLFDYIEQEEDKQISEKFNAGFLYDSFHNKQNKDKMISNVICYVLGILAIVVVAIVASFSVVLSTRNARLLAEEGNCESTCRVQIVESIPDGLLELRPGTNYTYNSWMDIINGAKSSLKLAHFYSNLVNDAVPEAAGYQGNDVHNALISAKRDRNIDIEIVMNTPTKQFPDLDTVKLLNDKIAKVYWLDWAKAFKSGIIHTKLMIADDDAFYLGSANMDWTSLSQVKELGIHVTNCKCLTKDVTKVYETYRYVARDLQSDMNGFSGFPQSLFSSFKDTNRLKINDGSAFFSSSPRIMAPGRNDDLEALLHVLSNSTSQINVSVMDYLPLLKYGDKKQYWSEIDQVLKDAVIRNVTVKMLISQWNHTDPTQVLGLRSLQVFGRDYCKATGSAKRPPICTGSIHIKMYKYPDPVGYQPYPFSRVNHAKYVVTEQNAYISTNNWSKDYFYNTGGISYVTDVKETVNTLKEIFDRDFGSSYTFEI